MAGHRPLVAALTARQLAALVAYLGDAVVTAVVATQWRPLAPPIPLIAILILLAGLKCRLISFGRNAA